MKYKKPQPASVSVPPVTGAMVGAAFVPWQPSTWPQAPRVFDQAFCDTLRKIFQETMLDELRNVVDDIKGANAESPFPLEHRGHVVAVACMCALDAIASYGYKNRHVKKFARNHFPNDYRPFANRIYPEYRLNLVHAWNLFGEAALLPGSEPIKEIAGVLHLGILNFVESFEKAVAHFLDELESNRELQARALHRYKEVTGEIEPTKVNRTLIAGAIGVAVGIALTLITQAGLRAAR